MMPPVKAETVVNIASGFGHLPITRQVGMFVGFAVSVALAIVVALWAREPEYATLFTHLSMTEISEISTALDKEQVPYKIDEVLSSLLVPKSKLYKSRMFLASDGLPRSGSKGFSNLSKEQKFGTSQFMEQAQYLYALQGELEKTINSFDHIR